MKNKILWSVLGMRFLCSFTFLSFMGSIGLGFYFLFSDKASLSSTLLSWYAAYFMYLALKSWEFPEPNTNL